MFSGDIMRTILQSGKSFAKVSRGERIRTSDPLVPNQRHDSYPPTKTQGKSEVDSASTPTLTPNRQSYAFVPIHDKDIDELLVV